MWSYRELSHLLAPPNVGYLQCLRLGCLRLALLGERIFLLTTRLIDLLQCYCYHYRLYYYWYEFNNIPAISFFKFLSSSIRSTTNCLRLYAILTPRRWYIFLFFTVLLSSFWTSRGHRYRPFPPGSVISLLVDFSSSVANSSSCAFRKMIFAQLFFFFPSGGWGKMKLELTTLPPIFIPVVC